MRDRQRLARGLWETPGASAASVGGAASANRASAGGAPGRSPSFCPAARAMAAACTRGIRRAAFSLAARRSSTASSRRDRSDCMARPAASSAASLASSGARFGGCRCSSAVRRLSSGARSGAGAAVPPCGGGRCSRAVTRALSGARSGICGGGRCSTRVKRASSAPSLPRQGLGRFGRGGWNGGMLPDPDQPRRQDQESGGGQRWEKLAPPRRLRGRRRWRLGCRVRRFGDRFTHRSSASIASWFG